MLHRDALGTFQAGTRRPLLGHQRHRSSPAWRPQPHMALGLAGKRGAPEDSVRTLRPRSSQRGSSCQASRKSYAEVEDDLDWGEIDILAAEPEGFGGADSEESALALFTAEAAQFANSFMDYVESLEEASREAAKKVAVQAKPIAKVAPPAAKVAQPAAEVEQPTAKVAQLAAKVAVQERVEDKAVQGKANGKLGGQEESRGKLGPEEANTKMASQKPVEGEPAAREAKAGEGSQKVVSQEGTVPGQAHGAGQEAIKVDPVQQAASAREAVDRETLEEQPMKESKEAHAKAPAAVKVNTHAVKEDPSASQNPEEVPEWGGGISKEERARMDQEAEEFAQALIDSPGVDYLGQEEAAAVAVAREEAPVKKGRKRIDRRTGRPKDFSIPLHLLPKVAIVGRPNVGKSALFNRITGSNLAIVYDYPGVTRDRMYTRAMWGTSEFVVVDTGGLMSDAVKLPDDKRMKAVRGISDTDLPMAVERQAAAGVAEADSLLLVVDGQQGLTASDEEIVAWLRRRHPKKPVTLAVNKCENLRVADTQAAEFWATGMEPTPVSAISGSGSGDLLDRLVATLPEVKPGQETGPREPPLAMAIIGRPNVGKSSLLNALVGSERSIVSPVSGTTRDAVDTEVAAPGGQVFNLIDTAGIRKRAAVTDSPDGAEPLSVQRAIQAVRRSQVAVLVLDAVDCTIDGRFVVTQQDFRLSELIAAEGRASVVVVNKWDAVPQKDTHTLVTYQKEILASLRPIDWATVVFTSALSGQRVGKILEAVSAAGEEHSRRVSTATLNMVVRETLNWRSPPVAKSGKKGKIYYATQAAVRPPTFVFFVNDPDLFGEDYRRYVARQLRTNIGFPGSPLRVYWRGKTSRPKPSGLGEES